MMSWPVVHATHTSKYEECGTRHQRIPHPHYISVFAGFGSGEALLRNFEVYTQASKKNSRCPFSLHHVGVAALSSTMFKAA